MTPTQNSGSMLRVRFLKPALQQDALFLSWLYKGFYLFLDHIKVFISLPSVMLKKNLFWHLLLLFMEDYSPV